MTTTTATLDFTNALTSTVKVSELREQINSVRSCLSSLKSCREWERDNELSILVRVANELIKMDARMNGQDALRKTNILSRAQYAIDVYSHQL